MADVSNPSVPTESKAATQLKRLQEANAKYKKLLQLAKERIQQQEEELQSVRDENDRLKDKANSERESEVRLTDDQNSTTDEVVSIVQVCQRVKQVIDVPSGTHEIWALVEMEIAPANDMGEPGATRRLKEWKRFDTETQLQVSVSPTLQSASAFISDQHETFRISFVVPQENP